MSPNPPHVPHRGTLIPTDSMIVSPIGGRPSGRSSQCLSTDAKRPPTRSHRGTAVRPSTCRSGSRFWPVVCLFVGIRVRVTLCRLGRINDHRSVRLYRRCALFVVPIVPSPIPARIVRCLCHFASLPDRKFVPLDPVPVWIW